MNAQKKTARNVSSAASVLVLQAQISLGTVKGIAVCSMQDVIKNIQIFFKSVGEWQQSCWKGVFSRTI